MNEMLMIGDVLVRDKGLVSHVGLVVGAGIAHVWPGSPLTVTSLQEFTVGKDYHVVRMPDVNEEDLHRRLSEMLLLSKPYSLVSNNCEQAVSYLLTGVRKSPQLQVALFSALVGGLIGARSQNLVLGSVLGGLGGLMFYKLPMLNAR